MTSQRIAEYLRRVRMCDNPTELARLRQELDARFLDDDEALRLVAMATLQLL